MPPVAEHTVRVPGFILFTADDYRSMAQACRVAAVQAEEDAKKQSNPSVVEGFLATAQRFRERAEKCELAARVL